MGKYTVKYETPGKDEPRSHEKVAAEFLAEYFASDIIFKKPALSKNPDFYVCKTHVLWELKSPIGNGKHTMGNNLRNANYQSRNIIIDLTRCKMGDDRAISRIREYLRRESHNIKKLKVIKKSQKVIDII